MTSIDFAPRSGEHSSVVPADGLGATRGQIIELDGLRGIAILAVLLHRFWPSEGRLAPLVPLADLGWTGVDLFFVVSGFLITGILLETRSHSHYFRNFYVRRMLRIFPLYYLFMSAVFLVVPNLSEGPYWETEFIARSRSPLWYLLYLGNVPEAVTGQEPPFLIAPVWSLAIEEQFYIVFPWVVAFCSRKTLTRLLLAALVLAPAFRLTTFFLFPENERLQYLATPSRIDVLAVGCLLAILVRSRLCPRPKVARTLLVVGFVVMVITSVSSGLERASPFGRIGGYSIVAFFCASLVLFAVLHRGTRATAGLRFAPLTYVGKLCYGLYLLHRPAGVIVDETADYLNSHAGPATLMIAKLIVSGLLATWSWYLFERPILRVKSRFESTGDPRKMEPRAVA